ncbi:caspase family protein [Candidatus Obscuribacterales bacterium]|nr:caspase family protein [Candidatus Obscuribacterales bacterium]MBX3153244.1 caspase family protein [Candidatus Obscuribacterales bacterium]
MKNRHGAKRALSLLSMSLLVTGILNFVPALAAEQESAENKVMKALDETASKRPIKDKWAVVIGVDTFKDSKIPKLRYPAKDAQDFAKFLVEKANFAPDHVLLLLNENATRNNIVSSIAGTWLPMRVLPDDLVVIYASTHGSPSELDKGGENFLVAYDTEQTDLFTSGVLLQDLAPTIYRRTHCDRVVLLLDACNSGAAEVGGKGLYRSTNFDPMAIAGKGQIVISSSGADQRSWESKRYNNGVFTRNLIEVLAKEQEKADLQAAFDTLKDKVQSEVKFDRQAFQTPVMHSKWEGEPLRIAAKPVSPRSVPEDESLTYKRVLEMKAKGGDLVKPVATNSSAPVAPSTQPVVTQQVVQQTTQPVVTQPAAQLTPVVTQPVVTQPVQSNYSSTPVQTHSKPLPTGKEAEMWLKFQNKNWR